MTADAQRRNVQRAARALAPLALAHELVITHGNGPQVGLLALQTAGDPKVAAATLDMLGAQTEGMIGYMIEQELGNLLPFEAPLATVLSMVEVDPADPAFQRPTKPIGPTYGEAEARALAAERGWTVVPDERGWRRVVASPRPRRIFETRPVRWLLERGCTVISAGGGGIPTAYAADGTLHGIEAVVDKDLASGVLARDLDATLFVMATDADAVYLDWGLPTARAIATISPEALGAIPFAEGSMGPKVEAAVAFASVEGRVAMIGALDDLDRLVRGESGTRVALGLDTTYATRDVAS